MNKYVLLCAILITACGKPEHTAKGNKIVIYKGPTPNYTGVVVETIYDIDTATTHTWHWRYDEDRGTTYAVNLITEGDWGDTL